MLPRTPYLGIFRFPPTNETVIFSNSILYDFSFSFTAEADAEGRFVFNSVPPGEQRGARLIQAGELRLPQQG